MIGDGMISGRERGVELTRKTILVAGGAGYVNHALTPALIADGHEILVRDTPRFGNRLGPSPRRTVAQGGIRDTGRLAAALAGCDMVINLACISNDTSFALDEALSTSIGPHAFLPVVDGVLDASQIFEDHPKMPLTCCGRDKRECEEQLAAANWLKYPAR